MAFIVITLIMLNLECVEATRKRKGSWSVGGQNGLLHIVRPQS